MHLRNLRTTKTSSIGSTSSISSKERAVQEKAKLAELIAEPEFLQHRHLAENKVEQLSSTKTGKS